MDRLDGPGPGRAGDARLHREQAIAPIARGGSSSAAMQAATNSSGVRAMRTTSPYRLATSLIAVLTTGLPAAMYSSVLVGLMKRVDSFRANGSRPTLPALDQTGQQLVGLLPEPVQVRPSRHRRWIDLDDRPDHDHVPASDRHRRAGGRGPDPSARRRRRSSPAAAPAMSPWSSRARCTIVLVAGAPLDREVRRVDTARQAEHVRMQMPLGLVEAGPAGQHQIGPLHELRLALAQLRWRPGKGGQLVHAVVDDGEGRAGGPAAAGPSACRTRRCSRSIRLPGKKVRDHRPEERELVVGESGAKSRA